MARRYSLIDVTREAVTIDDLNERSREAFVEAVGWVFENSPWVAERAWDRRPFSSVEALHEAMVSAVASAPREDQLALLRAHPDLGTVRLKPDTTVGSVRLEADQMSDVSTREQRRAGLDTLTRPETDRLLALNAAYKERFGFPFLYAVRGAAKDDVLNALERRLLETREAEFDEARRQVYRIARFRLEDLLV
jgi:2-oxo-4-hydroxy-4-carboxy-5-ureidoimidazoline decarboxylase